MLRRPKQTFSVFLKAISWVLIVVFIPNQVLWAADVRQMIEEAKLAFQLFDDSRRPSSSAEALAAAQTLQQSKVDSQNALADLMDSQFSLTTQNGDVLSYVGDRLTHVTRADGTELTHITLDAAGNITGADLRLSDGSIQVYQNGQVIGYETPDGTKVFYEAGRITRTLSRAGLETVYIYEADSAGAVSSIILENTAARTVYSADGVIQSSLSKTDFQTTFFHEGRVSSILLSSGFTLVFNETTVGEAIEVSFSHVEDAAHAVQLSNEEAEAHLEIQKLIYRGSILKEATLKNGTRFIFDENGVLYD